MIEFRIKFDNLQFHISPQSSKEVIGLNGNCLGRWFA